MPLRGMRAIYFLIAVRFGTLSPSLVPHVAPLLYLFHGKCYFLQYHAFM